MVVESACGSFTSTAPPACASWVAVAEEAGVVPCDSAWKLVESVILPSPIVHPLLRGPLEAGHTPVFLPADTQRIWFLLLANLVKMRPKGNRFPSRRHNSEIDNNNINNPCRS